MNTNNLEKNQVFKNYKELCKTLQINPKGGNAKKAQLKEIDRFVKLEKGKGHQLVVKEVYDTPQPKRGNNVYGGLIQILLVDYFIREGGKNIIITPNYIMQQTSMTNINYKKNKSNIPRYSDSNGYDARIIYDFFDTTDSTMHSAINTALKSLENQAVIMFTQQYIVATNDFIHRVATNEEREKILSIRNQMLKEYGFKNLKEAIFSTRGQEFKDELDREMKKNLNVNYVYKGYYVNVLQEAMLGKQEELISNFLTDNERKGYRQELNNIMIDRLKENAALRKQKAEKGFGKGINNKQIARRLDEYIEVIDNAVEENIRRLK